MSLLDELFREKTVEERLKALEQQVMILNQHRLNDTHDLLKILRDNGLKTKWDAIPDEEYKKSTESKI